MKEVPETGGGNVQSSESDRRRSGRFAFSAMGKVLDRRSGARMPVRISDIGRDGCYADTLSVFPAGTQVIVSIRHADLEFKTTATVVYALPSMGMGLQFKDTSPDMRSILDKWIAEARGEVIPVFDVPALGGDAKARQSPEQRALCGLLELLMQKKLLTEIEGAELLEELLGDR